MRLFEPSGWRLEKMIESAEKKFDDQRESENVVYRLSNNTTHVLYLISKQMTCYLPTERFEKAIVDLQCQGIKHPEKRAESLANIVKVRKALIDSLEVDLHQNKARYQEDLVNLNDYGAKDLPSFLADLR